MNLGTHPGTFPEKNPDTFVSGNGAAPVSGSV